MSQPSNINFNLGEAIRSGYAKGPNASSGSVLDLQSKSDVFFVLGAGTYTLPNASQGTQVLVIATGSVTLQSVAAVTTATLGTGVAALCLATSSTAWAATVFEAGTANFGSSFNTFVEGISTGELTEVTTNTTLGTMLLELYTVADLGNAKFTTSSTTTTVTPAAGGLTGARHVFWQNTADGALTLTPRTATQLYGDLGTSAYVGMSYLLTIVNRGDNTVTLGAASGITYTGEQTIATLVTRTYVVTFTSATAATVVAVSKGTIET